MASPKTITINGRNYDSVTGLPVDTAPSSKPTATSAKSPSSSKSSTKKPATPRTQSAASAVHSTVQRSKTLHRRVTKKPAATARKSAQPIKRSGSTARHMDIAPHPNVSKFAKNPEVKDTEPATKPKPTIPIKPATVDRPARVHPTAQKALARTVAKKASQAAKPTTAKQVKEAAISNVLATQKAPVTASKTSKKDTKKKAIKNSVKENALLRRIVIIVAAIILLLGILFIVYRLVPAISVGIASAQAGIDASYPEYTPDGYGLSHPVIFSDGEVDLKFTSNSNDAAYTITQTRSSWDSSAVLDNVVEPVAGANYETTKERGLTIYTFDNNASWVNGGILYKIQSDAPISRDQIRRIATSL